MATTTETIELTLTTSGGDTIQKTLTGVKEDLSEVEEEAQEAGQESSESMDRMGDAAQETAGDVDRAGGAMDQMTSSTSRMGGAGDNAREVLFSLGDTAQDAQFGIRGMGNNIGFAAEQASMLVQQAGGGRAALKQLAGAIVGPAGVVLAIQGLISLGPKIADFFEGSKQATDQWRESLDDAAGDMFEISEEAGTFEVQTLQHARDVAEQLQSELETTRSDVEDLERLSALTASIPEVREQARRRIGEQQALGEEERSVEQIIQDLRTRLDLEKATSEEIDQRLQRAQDRIKILQSADEAVQSQIGTLEAQKRLAEELEQTSADRADAEDEVAGAIQQQAEALKSASLDVAGEMGQGLQGNIPESINAPQLDASNFKVQTVAEVNKTIGILQRRLDEVDSTQMRSQIKGAIGELRGMKSEMKAAEGAGAQLAAALEGGLEQAVARAAQAAAEGENVGRVVLNTLANLADRVGKIAIGVGIGIKAIKDALKSLNPFVAIAAGAGLVALAAAARSALENTAESVEGGSERDEGPNVPRMREGGHVESGQPVLVGDKPGGEIGPHTELFVPDRSGTVVPNSQLATHRKAMSALSMARPPRGGSAMKEGLKEVARRLDDMEFRLRGTDMVAQQERTKRVYRDAGIR